MNPWTETHSLFWADGEFVLLTRPIVATAYYRSKCVDLLKGEESPFNQTAFKKLWDDIQLRNKNRLRVIHLSYEAFTEGENGDLLAIDITYGHQKRIKKFSYEPIALKALQSPTLKDYQQKFEKVYYHLLRGDCYQLNLTFPFKFSFQETSPLEFYRAFFAREIAPFAHSTFIKEQNRLFLSQSPECLINITQDQKYCYAMPIKGTIRGNNWKDLKSSLKDQGELFMIADLVRNDLSRIGSNYAKILHKKAPLFTSRLTHQYSLLAVLLDSRVSLLNLLQAVFPGGSVTGAPKKRVMELINEIEGSPRGLYTGSTFQFLGGRASSSINIRSLDIDLDKKQLVYGAGGGITLKSEWMKEYEEMLLKVESILGVFVKDDPFFETFESNGNIKII